MIAQVPLDADRVGAHSLAGVTLAGPPTFYYKKKLSIAFDCGFEFVLPRAR